MKASQKIQQIFSTVSPEVLCLKPGFSPLSKKLLLLPHTHMYTVFQNDLATQHPHSRVYLSWVWLMSMFFFFGSVLFQTPFAFWKQALEHDQTHEHDISACVFDWRSASLRSVETGSSGCTPWLAGSCVSKRHSPNLGSEMKLNRLVAYQNVLPCNRSHNHLL